MKISVPSYMIPAGYAENVEFISSVPQIQNVELLFFMWDEQTEELFKNELPALRASRRDLTFTVHMPDKLTAVHEIILDYTREFNPSYVIHPPEGNSQEFVDLLNRWRKKYGEIFFLENLIGREFLSLLPNLPGIPLCIDTGHLMINDFDPAEFIRELINPVSEVHLHGLENGKDHRPFLAETDWFMRLEPFLRKFDGILNLEVFHYDSARMISQALSEAGHIPESFPERDVPPPYSGPDAY